MAYRRPWPAHLYECASAGASAGSGVARRLVWSRRALGAPGGRVVVHHTRGRTRRPARDVIVLQALRYARAASLAEHSKLDPLGHTESMSAMLDSRGVRADLGDVDEWLGIYGVSPRAPALLVPLRLARNTSVVVLFCRSGLRASRNRSVHRCGPRVHGKRTVWALSWKRRVPRLVKRTDSRERCMPRAISDVRDARVLAMRLRVSCDRR
jgi:hypothetical protein